MTKYERAIYQIISRSCEHPTADQVFFALKAQYPSVSLATVYNNLNKLWAAGVIRKISLEGSPDRYDRMEKHHHLVCSRCGRLTDICFSDLTDSLVRQLGEEFVSYDLKVYHLCPECRQKEREAGPR